MFCKYCGQEIADDSVFCSKCGRNLKELSGSTSIPNTETENKPKDFDVWFYLDGTETGGPMSADLIKRKLLSCEIDYTAKVRNDSSSPWLSLIDSPFADIALKLTPAPISISDRWLWCLAIIPLAVTMLLDYFQVIPSGSPVSLIVPLAINALFFFMDKGHLEDKGIYSGSWMWLGFFLVPIYLVVRAVKTNRNFVPAVLWCFLFAVYMFIL